MDTRCFLPSGPFARDLETALQAWIAASRRACEPGRNVTDEQAEDAAWRRVRSVLDASDTATAA